LKGRTVFLLIFLVILADQVLKIWIKTNYHLEQSHYVIGEWFRLYFIENEGMAYGMKFGGDWGKVLLSLFRLAAVIFGVYYIRKIIREKYHRGFIFCVGLIFAGALGNLIDSMFYGLIFEESTGTHVAGIFTGNGYAGFLKGKVVDMLYFPIIRDATFPDWFPIWGGESFEFFRPIFNIADAAISVGVITIILFQKRFFRQRNTEQRHPTVETNSVVNDEVQVS
jgi:signal peptidase II